jgi:hypothetical protein
MTAKIRQTLNGRDSFYFAFQGFLLCRAIPHAREAQTQGLWRIFRCVSVTVRLQPRAWTEAAALPTQLSIFAVTRWLAVTC